MKYVLAIIFLSISHLFVLSQTFVNEAESRGVVHSYTGGEYAGGCSFFDFNRDDLADLSLTSGNGGTKFYTVNQQGEFTLFQIDELSESIKCLIWVDFDNDGDSDLSYTVYDGQFHLLENTGSMMFSEIDLSIEANVNAPNNGISWADFNNDGFLDFYVARYIPNDDLDSVYTNRLIKNNGDGTFTDITGTSGVGNGFKQSFSGSWYDYNSDGHIDLHIINDKLTSTNALYKNNGEETFTDVTQATGTGIAIDCMTNTVEDYDNDGDIDLFLSNGEQGNHLLRASASNTYQDLFPNSGLEMYQVCWGGNWLDYDHNGWKDLHVCSQDVDSNNGFFINNEGVDFERMDEFFPLEPKKSFSSAKGDLNDDGLYDLVVLNEAPDQTSLFRNSYGGAYGFVKLTLEGTHSNRDAVGTRIDYYVNGQPYTELTFAGTNYLSQDSQHKLLSLPNEANQIDSLIIKWPRGLIERYYDIGSGSKLSLLEGATLTYDLVTEAQPTICPNESTLIELAADCDSIVWANGLNSNSFLIAEPGVYNATLFFNGYPLTSENYIVDASPFPILDSVITTEPLCFGELNGTATIYSSSSGTNDPLPPIFIDSLAQGNYFTNLEIEDHCSVNANFQVESPSELFTNINVQNVSCFGDSTGMVTISSFGGTGSITNELTSGLEFSTLPAGIYEVISTDENGCSITSQFEITEPDSLSLNLLTTDASELELGSIEITISGGTSPYQALLNNDLFEGSSATGLTPGVYCISVEDDLGCITSLCDSVSMTLGINQELSSNLIVYPNPADNNITIKGLNNKLMSVVLYDSIGQEVIKTIPNDQKNTLVLDTCRLEAGVYYLRCNYSDNQKLAYQKIILN